LQPCAKGGGGASQRRVRFVADEGDSPAAIPGQARRCGRKFFEKAVAVAFARDAFQQPDIVGRLSFRSGDVDDYRHKAGGHVFLQFDEQGAGANGILVADVGAHFRAVDCAPQHRALLRGVGDAHRLEASECILRELALVDDQQDGRSR
jgi:hypothetical protein